MQAHGPHKKNRLQPPHLRTYFRPTYQPTLPTLQALELESGALDKHGPLLASCLPRAWSQSTWSAPDNRNSAAAAARRQTPAPRWIARKRCEPGVPGMHPPKPASALLPRDERPPGVAHRWLTGCAGSRTCRLVAGRLLLPGSLYRRERCGIRRQHNMSRCRCHAGAVADLQLSCWPRRQRRQPGLHLHLLGRSSAGAVRRPMACPPPADGVAILLGEAAVAVAGADGTWRQRRGRLDGLRRRCRRRRCGGCTAHGTARSRRCKA